jgi:putative ABC transport system substrate-binding protein
LHQLTPKAGRFGALVNPTNQQVITTREALAAAAPLGLQIKISSASTAEEIDSVFASMSREGVEALMVAPDSFFYAHSARMLELATRYALPAAFWDRGWVAAGGLMSYGSDVLDARRHVGIYTGRILKGEKAADLPVMRPTKFELVINAKTAKALGLTIPETLLATADEVIQ